VLLSWLQTRIAFVVLEGATSDPWDLADMIFQGTVLGPILWNIFYRDADRAIRKIGWTEEVFADDLNSSKTFPNNNENSIIFVDAKRCQAELHKWGRANKVTFDPGKESFHVISRRHGEGKDFKLLGVLFDPNW